jgi:uncharacterized membrane protein
MNDFLILLLKIWAVSSVIVILGCFLTPRLKRPNNTKWEKATIGGLAFYLTIAPIIAAFMLIGFVFYIYWWLEFFWDKIKDIEI